MSNYIKVMLDGKEHYLNDLLVQLPDYDDSFIVEVEGVKFELIPEAALEFTLDYGRDTYSQNAEQAALSVELMRKCEYACGFVREIRETI